MKRWWLSVALLGLFALSGNSLAQQEKDSPSQKTREALERFKQAPESIGKSLDALKDAVMEQIGGTPGTGQKAQAEPDSLTLPSRKAESPAAPRYSPVGKRDPFQSAPMRAKASRRPRETLSPLERYELGQLKVVGVVWNVKEPKAMVEDSSGLGYIVKVGTPIGPDDGKVKEIKPNEVVVEESYVDFYGARKVRRVSMKLLSK